MRLNISLDGGSTWSEYTPALMDFDRYPATLLRFVEGDNTALRAEGVSPNIMQATPRATVSA